MESKIDTTTVKPRPFTLAMLGTDTFYTPDQQPGDRKLNPGDYPKGELLSIIASLIATQKDPKLIPGTETAVAYISDEVQVINGPETLGSNVSDRIARGVAAIANAVVRGQTEVNLIAHSRGAVESIIIAHEISAIQKLAAESENLDELLAKLSANRPRNNNTGDIQTTLVKELTATKIADREQFFEKLKANLIEKSKDDPAAIGSKIQTLSELAKNCNSIDGSLDLDALIASLKTKRGSSKAEFDILLMNELSTAQQELKAEYFSQLKQNVKNTSINLFGLDPVPGDALDLLGYGIYWRDSRYFTIPSIVKHAEIMLYENERTYMGFTPIYPEAEETDEKESNSKQELRILSIPGHHGTGSAANNKSQAGAKLSTLHPEFISKTDPSKLGIKATHVQKLLMFKLVEFLGKHGVEFRDHSFLSEGRALGRKMAGKHRTQAGGLDFPAIYMDCYDQINANRKAYDAFNATHYDNLMLQAGSRNLLKKGEVYEEFYGTFARHDSENPGYVNEEHASLMQARFFHLFGLNSIEQNDLTEIVKKARKEYIKAMEDFLNPSLTSSLKPELSKILSNEQKKEDLFKSFRMLIHRVSQKYLTSDWSSKEKQEEKVAIFNEVKLMMQELYRLANLRNTKVEEFAAKVAVNIFNGLVTITDQQAADLIKALHPSYDEDLRLSFESLASALIPKPEGTEEKPEDAEKSQLPAEVQAIFASKEFKNTKDLAEKIALIWNGLSKHIPENKRSEFNKIELQHMLEQKYRHDPDKLYASVKAFIDDLDGLITLFKFMDKTVPNAAQFFAKIKEKIRIQSIELTAAHSEQLINLNKEKEEVVTNLVTEKGSLQEQLEQLKAERLALQQQNAAMAQQVEDLNTNKEALEQQVKDLNTNKQELETQVGKLTGEAKDRAEKVTKLEAQLNSPEEAKKIKLIEKDLIPLTRGYRDYLEDALQSRNNDDGINAKKEVIDNLLNILEDKQARPNPADRIAKYFKTLDKNADTLTAHRDKTAVRFIKNVLTAAALVVSTLIAGLGLAIWATYLKSGVSPATNSSAFWRPRSLNFQNQANKLKPTKAEEKDEEPNPEAPANKK